MFPSDFAATVRAHLPHSRAYLAADRGLCREVQQEEVRKIERDLVPVDLTALPYITLQRSTAFAVLICGLDDHLTFAKWLSVQTETDRIFAYAPKEMIADLWSLPVAGGKSVQLTAFEGFRDFHKHFGAKFNHIIYRDAKRSRPEGT